MRRRGISYLRSVLPLFIIPAAVTLVFSVIVFMGAFKGAELNKRVYSAEHTRLAELALYAELDFSINKISLISDYFKANSDKSVDEIRQIALMELADHFIIRPAFDRINVFEKSVEPSGGNYYKTLLNEELEPLPVNRAAELQPVFNAGAAEMHTRTDPVFDRKTEVLTVMREYPEWNWILTKSYFFEYESLYVDQEYRSLPKNAASASVLPVIFVTGGLIFLSTLILLLNDRRLVMSITQISEKRLNRLYRFNDRLYKLIEEKAYKIRKLIETKKKAEQMLDSKTKEYKSMNELLIAENMERLQQDRVLRAEKEKAEAANVMKREFLTNTSEKLKVMVSGIKKLSEHGSGSFDDLSREETADLFAEVHKSGDELMNMLGLIIELSRLESGRTEGKIALIDFHELFTKASYDTIPLFAETNSRLNVSFSGEPPRIRTRYKHIELALLHLLSAAAKNCRQGSRAELKYFISKSLRAGAMVNSVTLELSSEGFVHDFNITSVRDGKDNTRSSLISINIFKEALKHIGGSFIQRIENGLHSISVVIPDLGEPRE